MSEKSQGSIIIRAAKSVVVVLSTIRLLPHILLFVMSKKQDIIQKDLDRYADNYSEKKLSSTFDRVMFFIQMMTFLEEYRNVFYLRHRVLAHFLGFLCPPMKSLRIDVNTCGPGLFVHHGFGTMVTAETIGSNFTIRQLATIGYVNNAVDYPKIGNNVTIAAGARVLGAVTVGDDAVVAANSVVIADVPPGVTVMGVPAKVISWKPRETESRSGTGG